MKKFHNILSVLFIILFTFSCGKDTESNFTLKGKIKGLKKGIVYLQKDGDSTIVNLDSIVINGQSEFILKTNLDEPIILYVKLFKKDNEEHYIPFFADQGITEISTSLKYFNFDAKIKGSKQQKLLEDYLKVMKQYNSKNLSLIESRLNANKDKDSVLIDSINKQSQQLIKRKYSYTIQYALNHKDSEVAPYLALYEIPNTNPVFIDSIYKGLNQEIKNSFYGKKLNEVITSRISSEDN